MRLGLYVLDGEQSFGYGSQIPRPVACVRVVLLLAEDAGGLVRPRGVAQQAAGSAQEDRPCRLGAGGVVRQTDFDVPPDLSVSRLEAGVLLLELLLKSRRVELLGQLPDDAADVPLVEDAADAQNAVDTGCEQGSEEEQN